MRCRSRLQVFVNIEEGWVNVGILLREIRSLYLMKFLAHSSIKYLVSTSIFCFPYDISLFFAKT